MDVAASPARWTEEVATTAVMIERTQKRFGLQPTRLAADAAYGSDRLLGWLMARGIEPHVPVLHREYPAFKRSARERRKVKMLFAHLKRNLGLRRLRLRGPTGASDELLLAATAQNLRRLARNLAAPPLTGTPAPA